VAWIIVFAVLAVIVAVVAWLDYGRNKEVVSEVEVLNPSG
jgi:hypothetical protein